jgi:hypothetical protein
VSEAVPGADQAAQSEPPVMVAREVTLPPSLTVPRGATLYRLVRSIYGPHLRAADARKLMDEVRRLNPRITNPNVILAGDSLLLPSLPGPDVASVP